MQISSSTTLFTVHTRPPTQTFFFICSGATSPLSVSRIKRENKNRQVASTELSSEMTAQKLEMHKKAMSHRWKLQTLTVTRTSDRHGWHTWHDDNARNSADTCWLEQSLINDINGDIFLITVQGVTKKTPPKVAPPSTAGQRQAAFTDF